MLIFVFTLTAGAEGTSLLPAAQDRFSLTQRSIGLYMGSIWILYPFYICVSRVIKESYSPALIIYPA